LLPGWGELPDWGELLLLAQDHKRDTAATHTKTWTNFIGTSPRLLKIRTEPQESAVTLPRTSVVSATRMVARLSIARGILTPSGWD
jgi:hypothetical protein